MITTERIEQNKEKILELLCGIDRHDIMEIAYLLDGSDYFTVPASKKHHGNYKGGLAEHSLNVYELFRERNLKLQNALPEESVIICSLLHDLCKIGLYAEIDGEVYTIADHPGHKAHALLSIERINSTGFELTEREFNVIKYHMGVFGAFQTRPKEVQEFTPAELRKAIENDFMVQVFASCDTEESHTI
jgi:23S rRNA maturation-related 3'-5' exoribonuclease YhaM